MAWFLVCIRKNVREKKMPISANTTKLHRYKKMPVLAARSAISCFFSPRDRDSRAFMPTPVPLATAIISVCSGNARDTAFMASWLSLATKTLSTTLYNAWNSMETIMGTAIVASSFPTGKTPILFS